MQFNLRGKRETVRLGKLPKSQAQTMLVHIEHLAAAAVDGSSAPPKTIEWLRDLDPKIRKRLAVKGLCTVAEDRPDHRATLGELIAAQRQHKWKTYAPGTVEIHERTVGNLVEFWGPGRELLSISEGDAEDFADWLVTAKELAQSTAQKRCCHANQYFNYAVRKRWIVGNPFIDVAKSNMATEEFKWVTPEDARAVLDELPTDEWKLLFALSRWGGLRIGSEARALEWDHIDWKRDRFTVHSQKTKRYAGHATRVVPIFPELLPLLLKCSETADMGQPLVLPMLVGRSDASLRKTLLRAIRDAEVDAWPRLWHNLRAVRQTELENEFPTHVVCRWMGNSQKTAHEHYLKTTDDHFDKAAQKAAHFSAIPGHTESHPTK